MERKNILFSILVVINILIFIILIIINNKVIKNLKNIKYGNINYETKEKTVEEDMKIYPQGSFKIAYLYKGEVKLDMLYIKLYKLVNYLPKLYSKTKDLKKEELKTFYEMNKDDIIKNIEVSDYNQFEVLINMLSLYKDNEDIKYSDVIIDENSYKENEENVEFNINIIYTEGKYIQFKVYLNKKYGENHVVKFIPLVD